MQPRFHKKKIRESGNSMWTYTIACVTIAYLRKWLNTTTKNEEEPMKTQQQRKVVKIVLTGGPCGGKSTALSKVTSVRSSTERVDTNEYETSTHNHRHWQIQEYVCLRYLKQQRFSFRTDSNRRIRFIYKVPSWSYKSVWKIFSRESPEISRGEACYFATED